MPQNRENRGLRFFLALPEKIPWPHRTCSEPPILSASPFNRHNRTSVTVSLNALSLQLAARLLLRAPAFSPQSRRELFQSQNEKAFFPNGINTLRFVIAVRALGGVSVRSGRGTVQRPCERNTFSESRLPILQCPAGNLRFSPCQAGDTHGWNFFHYLASYYLSA